MTYEGRIFRAVLGLLVAVLGATIPAGASAFCGFYVGGAESSMYANATMTVLMRDGTRTVLSMQNNYQGPPEAFALVIPVPSVLQKDQVKVLPRDVFARVDSLGAPRLVEYWEVDPCSRRATEDNDCAGCARASSASPTQPGRAATDSVRVEAQFEVGEYDVVILSADDSSALDGWLRANEYNIPDGAGPILKPYVASGMKFFVAKVDPARVAFEKGQAALSPLRFHYDTPEFSLPVRLGLLNSSGSQDLIVNILARQRYELANYENVTIPTNIRVSDDVRKKFPSFYEALFARTLEKNPNAVVTEYAWSAASCDPCPTQPLNPSELATLGADVLETQSGEQQPSPTGFPSRAGSGINFTLTRLHARYTKDSLGEDLVFKQAMPIAGGRGIPDRAGKLDQKLETITSNPVSCQFGCGYDNFQGRYVILHAWEGSMICASPQRGFWGGPDGMDSPPMSQNAPNTAIKGVNPVRGDLALLVAESVPALDVRAKNPVDPLKGRNSGGCAVAAAEASGGAGLAALWLAFAATVFVQRRKRRRA